MPRLIDTAAVTHAIGLAALVEGVRAARVDVEDEDGLASLAPLLKALSNNRTFLGEIVVDELKARGRRQVETSPYGAQVVMLFRANDDWFVRANLWPAATDPTVRASGAAAFFYGVPHDHNFHFLTVGHAGPGYAGDYWEHDHRAVAGVPGEAVALRHTGRHRLAPGQVMLYRAHRDIHSQLAPERLSVSLNIMEAGGLQPWFDQYRIDVDGGRIAGTLNRTAHEPLLAIAGALGGGEGLDLLDHLARTHPVDRIAFAAVEALAQAAPGRDARAVLLDGAARRGRPGVAGRAVAALAAVEAEWRWIDDGAGTEPILLA